MRFNKREHVHVLVAAAAVCIAGCADHRAENAATISPQPRSRPLPPDIDRIRAAQNASPGYGADEYRRDQMKLKASTWEKDWHAWYQHYLDRGYSPEQAGYKAGEMMKDY